MAYQKDYKYNKDEKRSVFYKRPAKIQDSTGCQINTDPAAQAFINELEKSSGSDFIDMVKSVRGHGMNSAGSTGIQGVTGFVGSTGIQGVTGMHGSIGGMTGLRYKPEPGEGYSRIM